METIIAGIKNILESFGAGIGGGFGGGKTFGAPHGFDAFGQPIKRRERGGGLLDNLVKPQQTRAKAIRSTPKAKSACST